MRAPPTLGCRSGWLRVERSGDRLRWMVSTTTTFASPIPGSTTRAARNGSRRGCCRAARHATAVQGVAQRRVRIRGRNGGASAHSRIWWGASTGSEGRDLVVSAAVFPEAAAARWQLQAWAAWLEEGILDVAVPMGTRPTRRSSTAGWTRRWRSPAHPSGCGRGSEHAQPGGLTVEDRTGAAVGVNAIVVFSYGKVRTGRLRKVRCRRSRRRAAFREG